jgi:signal transduction histidine kinase/ligand-binding sensor domain-containing protein
MPPRRSVPCLQVVRWTLMLALWFSGQVHAMDSSRWFARSWQTDDGLPDNDVTGIAQNPEGYLWVSTQGGLTLFDGVRFREVELPTPSQRSRPVIRSMLLGYGNTLWLALEGGMVISLSADRTNVFSAADGLPTFRPSSLAQARDGSVWVGYVDGSACQIAAGKVTRFTARSGLSGVGPCVLANDGSGQIWFAKAGQLSAFRDQKISYVTDLPGGTVRMAAARSGGLWINADLELLKMEAVESPSKLIAVNSSIPGTKPSVIYEDHSGVVWLGTMAGGLFRVEGTNVLAVPTPYPDVLSIAEDREGNLWVGTGGGGLDRLRPRVLELHNAENGLPFSSVRSVCEDAAGNIWAAAQNGELARRENGIWQNVSGESGWAGKRATCVTGDGQNGVWVGTSREGLYHWTGGGATVFGRSDGLGGETVRALLSDREGNLWIALQSSNCVQRFRDGKFQTYVQPAGTRTVRTIAQDKIGTVWMGTLDGFLLRVEGDKLVDATAGTLPRLRPIRCLYAAPDGDLWIGYAGAGLGRIRNGKFSSISTDRGLHDAYICAMAFDDHGGFWLCSDHGIFQVQQRELEDTLAGKTDVVRSVLYGREESLPSMQGNFGYGPGFTRSRDGQLWFPTRAGLVVVNPDQSSLNRLVPPVAIERVVVDGQSIPTPQRTGATLPPHHRKIEIEFTALSFVAPENVGFRYKLEGWDDNWVNVPRLQRSVSYTRLPVGNYRFRVIACNNAGVWNETGAALPLRIEPFVWQTWWFRLGVLGALITGVALSVRRLAYRKYQAQLKKLEQEAALQKERARIAKDVHDELGASLTQISLLGKFTLNDLAVPEKAGAYIEKIAAIARQGVKSVDEIVWAVNPRNDTLSQLLDYAGQYAVDFLQAADIRCRIDFPEKVPACELPADIRHGLFMVVKEALNNAVKHSGASEMTLQAHLQDHELILSVTDNGRGFSSPKEDALADGLRNMRQRVADLGGTCTIESRPGAGTKVRVELQLP